MDWQLAAIWAITIITLVGFVQDEMRLRRAARPAPSTPRDPAHRRARLRSIGF